MAITVATGSISAHASVQVIGIKDSRAIGPTASAALSATPIQTDSFCVISTIGSVKLTFANTGGGDPAARAWKAVNAAGEKLRYQQYLIVARETAPIIISDPASAPVVITVARAAKSAAECGSGNISKGIVPVDPIPARGIYKDNITLAVTPI